MKSTKIAFLHTSPAHIPTFEKLLARDGVVLAHSVKEDWLTEAQNDGLSAPLVDKISNELKTLSADADAVICTCSSIGPVAQNMGLPDVFRVDQPMMAEAVKHTPVLLTMCLASTEVPSTELLVDAFKQASIKPNFRSLLCSDAWPFFEANNLERFGRDIADAIKLAIDKDSSVGCVVLAQASMAAAQPYLEDLGIPVFSSPALAAKRAMAIANL